MLWVSVQLLKSSDTLKTWLTARRLLLNPTLRGLFRGSVSRLAGEPFGIVHTQTRIDGCSANASKVMQSRRPNLDLDSPLFFATRFVLLPAVSRLRSLRAHVCASIKNRAERSRLRILS